MRSIGRVALLGAGVIGAGWAARLTLNGIHTTVFDPSAAAADRLRQVTAQAEVAYRKLLDAPLPARGELNFADSIAGAVSDADFVQESAPERMEIKRELLAEACERAAPEVVIASSSSGLLPSKMQVGLRYPERIVIGHPFNPVYLLPLVEIVGGAQTAQATRDTAAALYRSVGMHPLMVRKEVDAYIADRLMESLWREGLHLVNEGVATAAEVDQAICYGPGLRWAFMGSFLTYRIAGGAGGFRHFMEQFAPSLKWPWARFAGPDMDAALLDKLAAQSDAQAGDMDLAQLEQQRDDCLVAVLQGLRANQTAAGETLAAYEKKLRAMAAAK